MTPAPDPAAAAPAPTVMVWDVWVRLFHWTLVPAIAAAAATGFLGGALWLRLHIASGVAAAALVLARIVWGFLGTTHARFADFVPRRAEVVAHLRGGAQARHLGHNPLGALMVLAVLAAVPVLGLSGLALLGGTLKSGPLAGLSYGAGALLGAVHEPLAIGHLVLVGLHLAGVAFESRRSRENLARAMLDGLKPARPGDHAARARPGHGLVALILVGALGCGLYAANAGLSARAVPGLPVAVLDPVYQAECAACHMAYHPSLLTAASWTAMMAALADHFGENASLDAATTAQITAWLAAHAAETADTKAAHLLSGGGPDAPFTLTEARFWKHRHAGIPDAVFAGRAVGGRSNCAACHADAARGLFSPFALSLPEETLK
ncbi:cytochrome b/b6 domain-containing protein [Paracoccaceae bacterium Fryx2]|nr:cytochrome b/b6 domain-containing protein [Paracoccaceae bacterium Fryx2]